MRLIWARGYYTPRLLGAPSLYVLFLFVILSSFIRYVLFFVRALTHSVVTAARTHLKHGAVRALRELPGELRVPLPEVGPEPLHAHRLGQPLCHARALVCPLHRVQFGRYRPDGVCGGVVRQRRPRVVVPEKPREALPNHVIRRHYLRASTPKEGVNSHHSSIPSFKGAGGGRPFLIT
eukprot:1179312-Prorocentrum_minimum.AAC.2